MCPDGVGVAGVVHLSFGQRPRGRSLGSLSPFRSALVTFQHKASPFEDLLAVASWKLNVEADAIATVSLELREGRHAPIVNDGDVLQLRDNDSFHFKTRGA